MTPRLVTFLAAVGLAAALAPGASSVTPSRLPTLYFSYAMNCTFTAQDDRGNPITSIAPGTYQVDVRTPVPFGTVPLTAMGATDMTACHGVPQFQLTGPGVNLNTTVYGGCLSDEEYTETFAPSATYVAQDNDQPAVTRFTFTTLASGTPIPPPASASSGQGSSQSTDIVGSAVAAVRATLTGTLGARGQALLLVHGKAVTTLKAGRYRVEVADRDRRGGFTLQAPKLGIRSTLTGVAFVGTRVATVTLRPGRWTYASHSFTVVA